MVETLDEMQTNGIDPIPQDDSKATLTERLKRQDGEIDWNQSSEQIYRAIRAFHPWPGTFTTFNGKRLKILDAIVDDGDQKNLGPGKVQTDKSFRVGTGQGSISLSTIQIEGKLPTNASDFAANTLNLDGSILGN